MKSSCIARRATWALFMLIGSALTAGHVDAAPIEVRVGVVAYQDFDRGTAEFERLFGELAAAIDGEVVFQLTIGTYGDILYWIDKGLIDVALLTPGVFAAALRNERAGKPRCQYLASRLLPPEKDGQSEQRDGYHGVCVAAERSPLKTIDEVRRAWKAGRARFVFVDPLSASGRIAPAHALKAAGITPSPAEVEYSYSHTNSLRLLATPNRKCQRIAFVWDGAWRQSGDLPPFRRIDFPEIERIQVPADVVVARAGFEYADRVIELLTRHVDAQGAHDFVRFEDWRRRYVDLLNWTEALRIATDGDDVQAVSLDGIARLLRHYAQTRPAGEPLRLALVLSGGGAKCAYQIGVAAALEETLGELRRQTGDESLTISLVAGTSGGAINALAIALGTSQTIAGRSELRRAWTSLDQRDIVRPSQLVRGNIGLWFVAVELTVVLWMARRMVKLPERRAGVVITVLLTLAAAQIMASYLPYAPWRLLGRSHSLHHAWLWATFGIDWAGWCLLALALAAAVWRRRLSRDGKILALPPWTTTWGLAILLLGLPLAQVLALLFHERTLSDGSGMERQLLERFERLASFRVREAGHASLEIGQGGISERLTSLSRQILHKKLLTRDLVITASCLERSSEDSPSDLYFYAPASSLSPPTDYGERAVALAERPEILLDVVLGSGSIFPVFPARTLRDFPQRGESVELVDGGFAHNSPIEAAVRWGATHIILVEADPRQRGERRNFLQNAAGAFNHLYYQAQLVDARSRQQERVVVFSLRPEPPHLCLLDFADNLIDEAIDKGYREARGEALGEAAGITGRRRFRKELGEPFFFSPPE